ncbi:hypothetical protein BABINDRAFT_162535 [Babjeviella inositovora NRRL Y-12698]|uniref:Velvet domain-containing protein n=1 Tax=Babjeviella inositovora NRRL Y-12698 TaxID=984486 RepID=A0A1E3QME9_9ASCO|nr:uncharacterized protein BABINDRAFT_162535 [Babjeviella inositovora NRRL Y-12698]ODQ78863.1 hypothetical protein BABINDRAFT_162535 [Babjeviella inositovora NRRL Y-12698]
MSKFASTVSPISPRSCEESVINYELSVLQQPSRARACGVTTKFTGRRVIDPPPVVKLYGRDLYSQDAILQNLNVHFLTAEIIHIDKDGNESVLPSKKNSKKGVSQGHKPSLNSNPLFGSTCSSLHFSTSSSPLLNAFFVFNDLSVRFDGTFRIKFIHFEFNPQTFAAVKRSSIKSDLFRSYSAKDFPGLESSPLLIRQISELGCKVRVRNVANREAANATPETEEQETPSVQSKKRKMERQQEEVHTPIKRKKDAPRSLSLACTPNTPQPSVARAHSLLRDQSQYTPTSLASSKDTSNASRLSLDGFGNNASSTYTFVSEITHASTYTRSNTPIKRTKLDGFVRLQAEFQGYLIHSAARVDDTHSSSSSEATPPPTQLGAFAAPDLTSSLSMSDEEFYSCTSATDWDSPCIKDPNAMVNMSVAYYHHSPAHNGSTQESNGVNLPRFVNPFNKSDNPFGIQESFYSMYPQGDANTMSDSSHGFEDSSLSHFHLQQQQLALAFANDSAISSHIHSMTNFQPSIGREMHFQHPSMKEESDSLFVADQLDLSMYLIPGRLDMPMIGVNYFNG